MAKTVKGIQTANEFSLRKKAYLDDREEFDTLADMASFDDVPDGFITLNKENGKRYEYNSSNTIDTNLGKWREYKSGGSGTTNYNDLLNKPSINGVELTGNKTLKQLGIDLSKYTTTDKAVTSIELVDAIPTGSTGTTTEKCLRLTFADSTVTPVDVSVKDLNYDDTKIKADIKSLQNNKVDKVTGKSLIDDTEIARLAKVDNYDDKAIKASIKTVADGLMASAGYSPDYKKLDIITVGGVKKSIDLLPIISHAKITDLSDVDSTNQGNGKTLVYNSATGKHEYAVISSTDELVKMDASGGAKYLGNLIDKTTIVNDNGTLVAKTLDGLTASITELNYIKGLQMPVQDLVTAFANGGLKTIDTPFPTYADLQSYDVSTLLDDIRYLVRVLVDEAHDGKITAYLIKKGQTAPTFYGYLSDSRNFSTNPIDLVTEITGKLKAKNIDSDDLFALLTLSDVYKTSTAKNEIFGTHGAKAMYDELVANIGNKADSTTLTTHINDTDIHTSKTEKDTWNTVTDKASKSDLTKHTGDTNIHITSAERTAWNKKANTTDLTTHTGDTSIHITSIEREAWNNKANDNEVIKKADIKTTLDENSTNDDVYGGKAIFDAIKNNCVGKETVLYEGNITATGTYTLADDVNNYDFIVINHTHNSTIYRQSNVLTKSEISKCIDKNNKFLCVYGDGSASIYTTGYFNNNNVIISDYNNENITSITGYKFGEVTVQNTITNPLQPISYSTNEQLTGGTWIDGKPIYRRVVQVLVTTSDTLSEITVGRVVINQLTADGTTTEEVTKNVTKPAYLKRVDLSSFNIKQVTGLYGSAIGDNGNASVYCPCDYGLGPFCHIYYSYGRKELTFRVGEQYATSNTTWDVVLEYTKTTD